MEVSLSELPNQLSKGVTSFRTCPIARSHNIETEQDGIVQLRGAVIQVEGMETAEVFLLNQKNKQSGWTMLENQLTLVEEIPMDNPDGAKKKKKKDYENILSQVLNAIMFDRKLSTADVVRGTGIAFTTVDDWVNYRTETQHLDQNLMKLCKFLGVSLEYIGFGIGEDPESQRPGGFRL